MHKLINGPVTWKGLIALLSLMAMVGMGSLGMAFSQHNSQPHLTGVSYREFNLVVELIHERLASIDDKLDSLIERELEK